MARKKMSVVEAITVSLLTMADSLHDEGKIHQSLDPYLKLVEQYPDSVEAPLAVTKLLFIADTFRQAGQHHMALRVIERLEGASPD
jgi:outer membrane protein assembly factor BamD (BamD/ComL family)